VKKTTKDNKELEKYLSPADAARMVGTTAQAMSNLVKRGYFTTKMVAGRILVLRSEVTSFIPRSQGRPTKEIHAAIQSSKKPLGIIGRGNLGKYVSQVEAGRIRGVSKQAIGNLIKRGRLSSIKVAGRTLLLRSEVEAFTPQPIGHPKKETRAKTTKQKKSQK
jgi:hypothetical protein